MEDDLFLNLEDVGDQPYENISEDVPINENFLSALPDNIEDFDETKIDQLLLAVRAQYAQLEEENSRLIQLSNLIKNKIESCIRREVALKTGNSPFSFPLNLDIKPEARGDEEFEEEDSD
uniref:Uncharacterized protein n=1 Tax=Lygus hesperus TaxID=30085 RepID=A0A146M7K4_LYGHE